MYGITDLKIGTAVNIDGQAFIVTASQHSKQARGAGVMKTKMKNLITGAVVQKTFQGNDKLEPAEVRYSKAQYLYNDTANYFFMDQESFEQFELPVDNLGDQTNFLVEGETVDIQNVNGTPANVNLPPKVSLKVTQVDPGVKGDTASGGSKPATLETGLVIQVPLFINEGDNIRVNTESKEYCERV
ncbi:elongation factor P [Candidatus Peregrinibacteria bacterium]|jgi:elongation factor P|nr:elongation factor P [Candidatus Peregrinibacteria bacterium]